MLEGSVALNWRQHWQAGPWGYFLAFANRVAQTIFEIFKFFGLELAGAGSVDIGDVARVALFLLK